MAKQSINANKKGSAIFAQGGDQHTPLRLPKPSDPLARIESQRAAHLAARPPNQDVERLRQWVLAKEALETKIVMAGGQL